ncbi:MAG: DUF4373 domain-containing protein [Clostridiales bacterium]|nr:DUF4373 domain-containing protein [Clostridiales bacterium]
MSRPPKKGLTWFQKDVNYYQDDKIIELSIRYGPLGLTVYDALLTIIYREGYYITMSVSKAALLVARTVGDSWYRKNGKSAIDFISEIIHNCAEIGLFDESLLRQGVITSVGIQRRYATVTARNKVDMSKYWLLDKDSGQTACETMPKSKINVAEMGVSATETSISITEMQQIRKDKRRENEIREDKRRSPTDVSAAETQCAAAVGHDDTDMVGEVLKEYERLLPMLPQGERTVKLISNITKSHRQLEEYTRLFERASMSSFLTAASTGWKCDIEWLTEADNMDKVLAGRYDDYGKKSVSYDMHKAVDVNGVSSGFDTEVFFKAALERSLDV